MDTGDDVPSWARASSIPGIRVKPGSVVVDCWSAEDHILYPEELAKEDQCLALKRERAHVAEKSV